MAKEKFDRTPISEREQLEQIVAQIADKNIQLKDIERQINTNRSKLQQIIKELREREQEQAQSGSNATGNNSTTNQNSNPMLNPNEIIMPNLTGLTETFCNQLLLSLGLKLDAIYQNVNNAKVANGQSIKQSVPEGDIVNSGETIAVIFAKKIV